MLTSPSLYFVFQPEQHEECLLLTAALDGKEHQAQLVYLLHLSLKVTESTMTYRG